MTKAVPSMSRPPKRTASRKESLPAEPATLSEWWELAIANKDLLLVEGNPLTDLEVVADPERNFVVIVKDGRIVKRADGT